MMRQYTGAGGSVECSTSTTAKRRDVIARVFGPDAIIDGGGQIMVGTIAPIKGAAVAHDGKKTLAMLRRRPHEPIPELLARLDAAIATAQSTGSRIDEINTGSSDKRYVESDCRAGARASRVARRKRPARRRSALPQKKAAEETPAASLHEDRPTLSGRMQPRHRGRFPSGSSALRKLPVLCPHWRSCQ